jgi:hypothetical protein
MRTAKWYLIVTILFLNLDLKAQNFEIGYEFGYGKIELYYPHSNLSALPIFSDFRSKYYRTGFTCYYSPDSSILSIKTGIIYNYIKSEKSWQADNLKILQVPLGVDFRLGRKKHLMTGSGFYFNYLVFHKNNDVKFQNFQTGLYINLGYIYAINKKLSFDLKCQYGYDLTKMFISYSYSPIGGMYSTNTYSRNLFLIATLRYK